MTIKFKRQTFNIEKVTWRLSHRLWSVPSLLLLLLNVSGCSDTFEPFNEVDKFRVLAISADPPDLTEGEITTITPLIHVEDEDEPLIYKWSWCPIAYNVNDGGECIVDEKMVKDFAEAQVAQQLGEDASSMIEDFPFSFDLGDGPTASFIYAIPRQMLSDLCDQIFSKGISSFTGIPECKTSFDVVIVLEVTQGKKTLKATKTIPLYVDESRAGNENPEILDATLKDENGRAVSGAVKSGEWYDIEADIPKESVDTYLPQATAEIPEPELTEESLFMTWYVTGGETEHLRTTYIEDEVSMEVLRNNRWRVPSLSEVNGNSVKLYLVLQDEQGGAAWLIREFNVKEAPR